MIKFKLIRIKVPNKNVLWAFRIISLIFAFNLWSNIYEYFDTGLARSMYVREPYSVVDQPIGFYLVVFYKTTIASLVTWLGSFGMNVGEEENS